MQYSQAFSPEIITALAFIERSQVSAKIISEAIGIDGLVGAESTINAQRFQTNLLFIQRELRQVILSTKLDKEYLLFIDGIDIRPHSIAFEDYLDCIKGLANAVWFLNNDVFSEQRDSIGRARCILLVRPDIFLRLGLQNPNTKLRDNSVVLDWVTTYKEHRNSELFRVISNMFAIQQRDPTTPAEAWDAYFPFNTENIVESFAVYTSFIHFMRNSYYRPRDIITLINIIWDKVPSSRKYNIASFNHELCSNKQVENEYAEYLLGELRDQLVFYFSEIEYNEFIQFFEFLSGSRKIRYEEFTRAFDACVRDMGSRQVRQPEFMSSANGFLQFLYEMNVLSYFEYTESDQKFIRWCFRERKMGKMAPKVKTETDYELHYGLLPALNMGARRRRSR